MFANWGVICFVALTTVHAEFKTEVMDTKVEPVKDKECPDTCSTLMNTGLSAISAAFNDLAAVKELKFSTGYCDVTIRGLGNFKHTYKCMTSESGDIHDHSISITFNKPNGTYNCKLPNDPAGAAKKISDSPIPKGSCGQEKIGDKLEKKSMKCGSERGDDKAAGKGGDNDVQFSADLSGMVLNLLMRADSKGVFPLKFDFSLPVQNPGKLENKPEFEEAWKCISNEQNMPILLRSIFSNSFKPIFSCMDDKDEHKPSLIENILYMAGSCKGPIPDIGKQ